MPIWARAPCALPGLTGLVAGTEGVEWLTGIVRRAFGRQAIASNICRRDAELYSLAVRAA